jgi:hypothetical protein
MYFRYPGFAHLALTIGLVSEMQSSLFPSRQTRRSIDALSAEDSVIETTIDSAR